MRTRTLFNCISYFKFALATDMDAMFLDYAGLSVMGFILRCFLSVRVRSESSLS
jgi:hypothetical protein